MKIALMTNNYKPYMGGVPISIERLKRGLEMLGHEVTVFAPTYEEQQQEENVFRYASGMKHFIGGIVLPNPFDRRIDREFARQKFDIIHVHHPVLIGRTAIHLSKKYHIPLVFTYHTRYEKYVECYTGGVVRVEHLMRLYLRMFMKHCQHVFAPTEGIRDYLIGACSVSPDKLSILPTGIEEGSFRVSKEQRTAVRRQCAAEQMPLFLTVARLAQEKNIRFLLESVAAFKVRYQKPFRLVMVGDGPDRMQYEKACEELQIEDEVIFTGTLPNEKTAAYYAAADAFLFASKTETQGIVILEAFAGRTPVIAVRASGVEDLVTDGVNGYLMPENQDEFASAMLAFCGNGALRRQMEEHAGRTGLTYREEAVAEEAVRVYNEIITNHRQRLPFTPVVA